MDSLAQIRFVSRRESGFALLGPHRLKELSLVGTASAGKLTIYDTDTAPVAATYGQSGTTVTVAKVGHGLSTGDVVGICFASGTGGTATSGNYPITVTGADAFTITMINSVTITADPACNYVANSGSGQPNPKRWLMCKNISASDVFANVYHIPNSGFATRLGTYFLMTNLSEADVFYE